MLPRGAFRRRVALLGTLILLGLLPSLVRATTGAPALEDGEGALIEEKSGLVFPEQTSVVLGDRTWKLEATGVGIRQATFMKIDVYSMASYVDENATLEPPYDETLVALDAAKQLRIVFLRDVPMEKIREEFRKRIEKNYPEGTTAFQPELERFIALFREDVKEGERFDFTYLPGEGLSVQFRGDLLGWIRDPRFGQVYWSVYFGRKPESRNLASSLLRRIGDPETKGS